MFSSFQTMAKELHGQFLAIYWALIAPMVLIVILLEFFKGETPAPDKILRRVFISTLLILSFDYVQKTILYLTDQLTLRIEDISKLSELTSLLKAHIQNMDIGLFAIRKSLIYILGFFSYLFAYIGVFTAQAVIQFSWAILYICSPLMIMAYISEKTASVTGGLYKGMIHVCLWKILAAILGVLLLEFAKTPSYNEENLLTVVIINLCIASSLLLVPFTVKSLVGDGLTSSASVMAALPGVIASKHIRKTAFRTGNKMKSQSVDLAKKGYGQSRKIIANSVNSERKRRLESKVAKIRKKAIPVSTSYKENNRRKDDE